MASPKNKTSTPTTTTNPKGAPAQPIPLHPAGDVVLTITDPDADLTRTFLVSSTILALASPVLAAMLGPNFAEGAALRTAAAAGERAAVRLEEDDVEAMDFILSHIHFRGERTRKKELTARTIAAIAVQCDKYDFGGAMEPWVRLWCHAERFPVGFVPGVKEMGYGLLAAFLFQSSELGNMAREYGPRLPPDFGAVWKRGRFMGRLPKLVSDTIARQITEAQKRIRSLVLETLADLHRGPVYPWEEQDPEASMHETTRGARYITALEELHVWPSLRPFEKMSVDEVAGLVAALPDTVAAYCEHSRPCQRWDELQQLIDGVDLIRMEMDGVSLDFANNAQGEEADEEEEEQISPASPVESEDELEEQISPTSPIESVAEDDEDAVMG